MPSKPATDIADACSRRANFLAGYARRLARRCASEADVNQVFAGAYVSYVTYFENQIELLFIGLLTGRLIHSDHKVRAVVAMPNARTAKSLILGGKRYVDWLPFDQHTKPRSLAFFVEGAPFADLSAQHRASLDKASVLRNALAHSSDHALKRFQTVFVDGHSLPPAQQSPAGFLRGAHSLSQNRFEVQLAGLVAVMNQLTT
jgi:hypothetical protein